MQTNHKKKLISGYIMAICGFILILITAMNYLFGWKLGIPPAAIGIVFVAVGMALIRKIKKSM